MLLNDAVPFLHLLPPPKQSVVILFIVNIDELFYDALLVINVDRVETMSLEGEEGYDRETQTLGYKKLEGEVETLKNEFQKLQKTADTLHAALQRRVPMPQDGNLMLEESPAKRLI